MIVATTPLRISLFGGSTDHPFFIREYGHGSVISFASSLKTYVSLSQDIFGRNRKEHKFVVNYSRREEVETTSQIQNAIVRSVLEHFDLDPIMVTLTSDIFAEGSGLASSSSYIIGLIKAVAVFKGLNLTDSEICALAYEIELALNPYCGQQDPYGCGTGGFKRMNFRADGRVSMEFIPGELFERYDVYLKFTGITRDSATVLEDISHNTAKALTLLAIVDKAHEALLNRDFRLVFDYLQESWEEKKKTSKMIVGSEHIRDIDDFLSEHRAVLAHKLCGAGNGGFFMCFTEKDVSTADELGVKVEMSPDGVKGHII